MAGDGSVLDSQETQETQQETQRGLDFRGRLADTIDNIFSPQDQPQGLLRGSVFLGEAKIVEGMRHAR